MVHSVHRVPLSCFTHYLVCWSLPGPFLTRGFCAVMQHTLAYTFTEDSLNASASAPPSIHKGTIVQWAPIAVDQAFPLESQQRPDMYSNQLAVEQLMHWAERARIGGGKLYSWIYYFNDMDFIMPQPNWFNIEADIKLLAANGVRGVFAEGEGSYPVAEMDEMRSWLLASLSFDPSRNGTALMHEFLRGFYGEQAAPLVLQHMKIWTDAVLRSSPPGNCTDVIDAHVCPRKLDKHANATAPW